MKYTVNNIETTFQQMLSASIHDLSCCQINLSAEEWRSVVALSRIHNVLQLIFEKGLENAFFMATPEHQVLAFEMMAIVAGQARRTEAFLSLYKHLTDAKIHPIVMKGLICRELYGEYCDYRPYGDKDILIRKTDYKGVQKVFE